jgi:hypothetical protein
MLFSQNLALGRADPTLVDVDFNSVSLLLGFENNLTDDSPAKNTATVTGTITYDSSIKKWDTYSGSMASGANFLTFSNTGSFYFATGDFTIETWVYVPTGTWGTGNVNVMDIAQRKNGVQGGPSGFFLSTSSLTVSAFKTAFYDNTAIGFVSSTAVLPTNAWHHIVTGRRGTAIYLGTNGTLQNMGTSSKNWFPYSPRIHCDDYQEYGYAVKFDEFRVTKGVWRYGTGSTYTTPTTRFPRQ